MDDATWLRRLGSMEMPDEIRRIFARVQELIEADRMQGPFSLNALRARDQPDGTIVRWSNGDVGFVQRRYSTVLKCDEWMIHTASAAYVAKPDDLIDVILTPAELASHFIYSPVMQDGCRMSMLMMQATHDVIESDSQQREIDEAQASPRRQALFHAKRA